MFYPEGVLILAQLTGKWFRFHIMRYLNWKKLQFFIFDGTCCHFISSFLECDKVRLAGGTRCSGRVEVYHANSWGTVCDDQWSLTNADVVCREVKCGTVLEAKKSAFFGEGKDQIWLDDIQCNGQELSILKCAHREFGENNCGHGEDAGVVCSGSIYLLQIIDTQSLSHFVPECQLRHQKKKKKIFLICSCNKFCGTLRGTGK